MHAKPHDPCERDIGLHCKPVSAPGWTRSLASSHGQLAQKASVGVVDAWADISRVVDTLYSLVKREIKAKSPCVGLPSFDTYPY